MNRSIRFSRRLIWDTQVNPLSRRLRELRSSGVGLLDLTSSNPTQVLASYPHNELVAAYASLGNVTYRPEAAGIQTAREAISAYYARRGVSVSPERIVLTASSSEAYALLFKLLCDAGDQVLVPSPSYPLFDYLAGLEGISAVAYPLRFDGAWVADLEQMREAIKRQPNAIVIVNPNNPTGSYWQNADLLELFRMAEEATVPVISDEVFSDYRLGHNAGQQVYTLAQYPEHLSFSLNGLSKVAGMPQVKLGWIVLNGPEELVQTVRARLELILDTYLSVSTPVQGALLELLRIGEGIQSTLKSRIELNYAVLQGCLAATSATVLWTEGGWSALVQLPNVLSEDQWVNVLLEQHSVVTQPGYYFDLPFAPTVVLSLITPEQAFAEGVERMRSGILAATRG